MVEAAVKSPSWEPLSIIQSKYSIYISSYSTILYSYYHSRMRYRENHEFITEYCYECEARVTILRQWTITDHQMYHEQNSSPVSCMIMELAPAKRASLAIQWCLFQWAAIYSLGTLLSALKARYCLSGARPTNGRLSFMFAVNQRLYSDVTP